MADQLALFNDANDAGTSVTLRAPRLTAKQVRSDLRHWRGQAKAWRDGGFPDTHPDYCLAPGTDEGDCSTAFRRAKAEEATAHAAALQAQLQAGAR